MIFLATVIQPFSARSTRIQNTHLTVQYLAPRFPSAARARESYPTFIVACTAQSLRGEYCNCVDTIRSATIKSWSAMHRQDTLLSRYEIPAPFFPVSRNSSLPMDRHDSNARQFFLLRRKNLDLDQPNPHFAEGADFPIGQAK